LSLANNVDVILFTIKVIPNLKLFTSQFRSIADGEIVLIKTTNTPLKKDFFAKSYNFI
jgi:hypothetical protein